MFYSMFRFQLVSSSTLVVVPIYVLMFLHFHLKIFDICGLFDTTFATKLRFFIVWNI